MSRFIESIKDQQKEPKKPQAELPKPGAYSSKDLEKVKMPFLQKPGGSWYGN